jgi:hypothetical protein
MNTDTVINSVLFLLYGCINWVVFFGIDSRVSLFKYNKNTFQYIIINVLY